MPEQPRIPGGIGGGQFDRVHHAAADDIELPEDITSGGTSVGGGAAAGVDGWSPDLENRMTSARTGDHHDLNQALRDPDPMVRSEATVNPRLTRRQHARLARDKSMDVRIAAACRPKSGGADLAASDPSPLVRIRALSSHGLSDEAFQQLDRDPEVQRILSVVSR